MAQVQNFVVDQGSRFLTAITLDNPNGSPRDLTNYGVRGQIRKNYTSIDKIDFITIIPTPILGQIVLLLNPAVTRAITPGRYVYDIEVYSTSDVTDISRVLEGLLSVTPAVTQTP